MTHVRTAWRALLLFVTDVLQGSVLLLRQTHATSTLLHRKVRDLSGSAAAANKGASKQDQARNEKKPADAVARGLNEKGAATGEATAKAVEKKGKEGARRKRSAWTLDRLAGLALIGWAVWCFGHRPVATGWHALTPFLARAAPWGIALWIVAAWLTALCAKDDARVASGPDRGRPGAPDPDAVRGAGLWLWRLVAVQVAAAVGHGRKGVHLRTLLTEPGIPDAWDVTTLREHCERLGIPVKPIRIRGSGAKGPTHGVHVDDLTAALGMPLDDAITALTDRLTPHPRATLPETPEGASPDPSEEVLSAAPVQASSTPPEGRPYGLVLGAWLAAQSSPISTPHHTPLPGSAPTSSGRG
ncbi:hypothetical protein ACIQI8_27380 [Streptomyces sp. NPDC092369]|uniref:hypothetical protein n=1 Tax=Streptomyces sp. NPDC092369 TaxID=3366015 RepID=UPI00382D324D